MIGLIGRRRACRILNGACTAFLRRLCRIRLPRFFLRWQIQPRNHKNTDERRDEERHGFMDFTV